MVKEHGQLTTDLQKTFDICITAFSFITAYFIKRHALPGRFANLSTDPNYYLILLLIIITWYIAFKWMGMYLSYRQQKFWQFFITIIKSCLLGMVLLSMAMYVLHIKGVSRLLMGIFLILNIGLLILSKFIIFKTLERIRTSSYSTRSILIVGSRERAKDVIRAVEKVKGSGYKILGCFDVDETMVGHSVINGHKVVGVVGHIENYLRNNIVDELIFAIPLKKIEQCDRYIALAESMGIKVRIIPDWEIHYLMYRPNIATIRFEEFLGVYNMALQSTPQNEGEMLIKIIFDYLMAAVLTLLLLPVFVIIGYAIKKKSSGPVFYTQERLGMNGRKFPLYKFRTMVSNADEMRKELEEMNEMDGPAFKIKDDPRIIPGVGHFLRKTSLDELPQLFNVLRGR